MNFADILSALHQLPRADKFRAVQYLTTELALEEAPGLISGAEYPVWSPYAADSAATTLANYFHDETAGR